MFLDVHSEKQLCDHLLFWIAANKERCTEDAYITLLKQVHNNAFNNQNLKNTLSSFLL